MTEGKPMRMWLIALLGIGVAAPATAFSVRAGIEAWQQGDATRAVAIWRPLAEKGDADAAFNLGQAYRLGRGVSLDLAQAQNWLERAARLGHMDAQSTLGLLLFQNGNRVSAMRWLQAAAEAGEPRALLVYGTALFNGDGVASDPVTAYAYVSRAAAQGLDAAKATLADMDQILPIEQRRKGVALAQRLASAEKPPASGLVQKRASPSVASADKPAPPAKNIRPAPPPAKAQPAGKGGAWRIQLGAFSQRSSAESLFARLAPRLASLQPFYVPAGKVTRLQVGPFESRAAAAAGCARIAPQPCFPVERR